ncbi:hypothetical protein NO042_100016 [Flavobacterium psychrophilum]|nr:hypothetical protein IT2_20016 [Flavobacterium psychrophilum]SNB09703.1 hypothetical protein JIP0899_20016 [Flavobacterium psychrophilum]SNB33197.1 hypothetical protein NO042_100016 [Flavobacterium psychrophilum]
MIGFYTLKFHSNKSPYFLHDENNLLPLLALFFISVTIRIIYYALLLFNLPK